MFWDIILITCIKCEWRVCYRSTTICRIYTLLLCIFSTTNYYYTYVETYVYQSSGWLSKPKLLNYGSMCSVDSSVKYVQIWSQKTAKCVTKANVTWVYAVDWTINEQKFFFVYLLSRIFYFSFCAQYKENHKKWNNKLTQIMVHLNRVISDMRHFRNWLDNPEFRKIDKIELRSLDKR